MKYNYEVKGEMIIDADDVSDYEDKKRAILQQAERKVCRAFNEQCIIGKIRVVERK